MAASKVVSVRTWAVAACGVAVSILFMALIRAGVGGSESGIALVGNAPSMVTAAIATAAAFWASWQLRGAANLRRQWMLIGAGTVCLLAGDTIYMYLEVVAKDVPFPSVADAFYLLSFPVLGAGVGLALLSFRGVIDLRVPLVASGLVAAGATAALWGAVFAPIIYDSESSALEKVLSVFYPVGDFWLLIFPALALTIALARLGGGRVAWPWWAVVVGLMSISVADTLFALAEAAGTYASGSPIDLGWWLGYTAIAVGASLAVDVQSPHRGRGRS